jgi:hypothetical protein
MLWHICTKSGGLLIIGSDARLNVLLCKSLHQHCQHIKTATQSFDSLLDRNFSFLQCYSRYGSYPEEYFKTRLRLEILFLLWQRQSHAQP